MTENTAENTCGHEKDDGTVCGLPAGWGTSHVGEGRCRHHPGRGAPKGNQNAVGNSGGGAPEGNDNAVTHGAFAEGFESRLTEREKEARKEILADYDHAGGRHVAMQIVADLAQKYQRSGDPRFARRYEALHEVVTDDEEPNQHAHIHQHLDDDGEHTLTDQERADIKAMFEDRQNQNRGQDQTLDVEVDETVSTAAPSEMEEPDSEPEVRFDW